MGIVYHYIDVIMTTMASQITSLTIVYSIVYSDADQRKHQSSASLAFVWGIHRDRWIPRTKGQLRGKCFHLMTSSCTYLNHAHGSLLNCFESLTFDPKLINHIRNGTEPFSSIVYVIYTLARFFPICEACLWISSVWWWQCRKGFTENIYLFVFNPSKLYFDFFLC